MTGMAERITIVSAERVREELVKLVMAPDPVRGLRLLVETGLAEHVLPELPALALERDEHHRHKDVYEHTLTVLEQSIDLEDRLRPLTGGGPDFVSRFAALMHDVGKPRTRRFAENGVVTFHHHDVVGAKLTRKRMQALKFPKDVRPRRCPRWSSCTCGSTGTGRGSGPTPPYAATSATPATSSTGCTCSPGPTARRATSARPTCSGVPTTTSRRASQTLSEQEELASIRPDLDGNQIMEILGIGPGREVGEAYRFLLELRLDHGPDERGGRQGGPARVGRPGAADHTPRVRGRAARARPRSQAAYRVNPQSVGLRPVRAVRGRARLGPLPAGGEREREVAVDRPLHAGDPADRDPPGQGPRLRRPSRVASAASPATAAASAMQHQVDALPQLSTTCSSGRTSSSRSRSTSPVRAMASSSTSRAEVVARDLVRGRERSIRSPIRSVHMLAMTWMPPTCSPSISGFSRGRYS